MQMIRTTVSLPEDLYNDLRLAAFREKKSLSRLLVEKIENKKEVKKTLSVEERVRRDFAFFDKVARSGVQINAVKAVREERDRDNA